MGKVEQQFYGLLACLEFPRLWGEQTTESTEGKGVWLPGD